MADLVGQTLGNYRVESRLGSGGMGDVYRANHIHLNRPAAIKVLHATQAHDPTFQARFLREARAAAALRHPNIVEVFDFGEQDDASYLVMELIPDGSLRTLLRQRSTGQGWSLGLGVDLVRQAAEGLDYAHAHGMVHRDIKPDNLLLQRLETAPRAAGAEPYLLKISDFGLARLMEDSGELTQTGVVMGTPAYMSPEQCQGGTLDGRSDLYSLGVVLYEAATGSPPFRVRTLSEAVFKHISAPPTPPRSVFPDLPPALEDVIMRCLAKRPEDRYATGAELADALDGSLGDTELRTIVPTMASSGLLTPTPMSAPLPAYTPVAAPVLPPTPTPAPAPTPAPQAEAQAEVASAPTVAAEARTVADSAQVAEPPTAAAVSASLPVDDDSTVLATPDPQIPEAPAKPWSRVDEAGAGVTTPRTGLQAIPPWARNLGGVVALVAVLVGLVALLSRPSSPTVKQQVKSPTATAHVAVSPTASPTPVETVLYQQPLTSATHSWPISSHSFFADGGYELAGAWIAYTPTQSFSNGSVSVQVRQLSGPADQFYGLLLRGANGNLYYFFGVNGSQQWTFSLVQNGNGQPIVTPTTDSHINAGLNANNTITVRADGGHFTFSVNGAQVGQTDNSVIAAGDLGLINTVGNLTVVYNNFTITG